MSSSIHTPTLPASNDPNLIVAIEPAPDDGGSIVTKANGSYTHVLNLSPREIRHYLLGLGGNPDHISFSEM